jgi:hypothetical protein
MTTSRTVITGPTRWGPALVSLVVVAGAALSIALRPSALSVSIGVPVVVVGCWAAVRSVSARLVADDEGVTVRNVLATRRWRWDQIGEIAWDIGWTASMHGICVCPLGDPYPNLATATVRSALPGERPTPKLVEYHALLQPLLVEHGIDDHIVDGEPATERWYLDPRSQPDSRSDAG